jgi:hypothetical protein
VRRAVDEVGVGDDGGGEAHDGPVEPDDEDLGVCGKGFCDVEVEGDEGLEELLAGFVGVGGVWSADRDVCAAVFFVSDEMKKMKGFNFLYLLFKMVNVKAIT